MPRGVARHRGARLPAIGLNMQGWLADDGAANAGEVYGR